MAKEFRLADIVVDCPDEKALGRFYAQLLGWKEAELFGHPAVVSENGVMLLFVQEEDYLPPVWPEQAKEQQKQVHFDFIVPDVAAAVARAVELGAKKAEAQFGGKVFVTVLDPAGHPICLVQES